MYGQPPSPWWSPTIPRMVTGHLPSKGWSGHPPFKIGSCNFKRRVTHHPQDGHPPSPGWSPILQNMVTHLSKDCHPAFKEWSTTIPSMVNRYLKLIKSDKTLRSSNQKWSLTLTQPSLLCVFITTNIPLSCKICFTTVKIFNK